MTTKKFDEYYSIDVKEAVKKSAEAFKGFNKAVGQFSYDLERMQQTVESPSYTMPSGLTRMERRDWSAEHREIIGNTWDHTLLTPSPVELFNELYMQRIKEAVKLPVYKIPAGLIRDEYLREYFGDWRVEKPFDEY